VLEELAQQAHHYGVSLSADQLEQFTTYASLLREWNIRTRLVSDASEAVVARRHFTESIALGCALRRRGLTKDGTSLLDIGSGAGFPGAVIALVWPGVEVTLLEATAKKAAFLIALVERLPLANAHVVSGRAEDLGRQGSLREAFDVVTARAVAPVPTLLELALPFLRLGGWLASPKGTRAEDELESAARALELLGGEANVAEFEVPGPRQSLVLVRKVRPTPDAYPRRAGMPGKSPL
jgi:16S rRNA (guanine527-N7)-methyltransferase